MFDMMLPNIAELLEDKMNKKIMASVYAPIYSKKKLVDVSFIIITIYLHP